MPNGESLQAAQTQIAAQKSDLGHTLPSHNSYSGLCKLPVEIVGRILKLSHRLALGLDADQDVPSLCCDDQDYTWLRLALTCSYVWSVAVKERELWSFIEYVDEETEVWAARSVSRAGNAPLHIRAVGTGNQSTVHDWAALYLFRAQVALIVPSMQEPDGLQRLTDILYQPAPFLQRLSYTHYHFILDSRFLGGTSRMLSSLFLCGVEMTPGTAMPVFPALSHLHLASLLLHSYDLLFALLKQAPGLKSVHIASVRYLPQGPVSSGRSLAVVQLPQLESLLLCKIRTMVLVTLLKGLPTPTQQLVLEPIPFEPGVRQRYQVRAASTSEDLAYIDERAQEFWACHGGSLRTLPGGMLTFTTAKAGWMVTDKWVLEYASPPASDLEAYPRLLYRVNLSPRQDIALLDGVRTFKLNGGLPFITVELSALGTIIIEDSHIRHNFKRRFPEFVAEIRERVQAGTDIQTRLFVSTPALREEMGEQLEGIVPHVLFRTAEPERSASCIL